MPPAAPTAVCFDLMGTVLYDPYLEALEASTGLELAVALARKDPDCWPLFELGRIDEAEFARRFFAGEGGAQFDVEAFNRVRRTGYRFLPGMAELVTSLEGRAQRYVASNYPVWIEEVNVAFELDRRFDGVFASCHLGVRKPDVAFFELLLDRIGHGPHECLFVDDREDNCAAAERAGMRAHVFVTADDLAARLASEGLAPSP